MMHELIDIVNQAIQYQKLGVKCVLATVVALDGSSYRKPGVRMLISDGGDVVGAVSGGCVEKEVVRRAASVFESGSPKVMTYDGRYRLGCEGVLYILIEPFIVSNEMLERLNDCIVHRQTLQLISCYEKSDEAFGGFGTIAHFEDKQQVRFGDHAIDMTRQKFEQRLNPQFRIMIIGAEHDAVHLCKMAAQLGWEVMVLSSFTDPKTTQDFPEAKSVLVTSPEMLDISLIDDQTAVVLMSHNYAYDLKYLLAMKDVEMVYLGILGSMKRRNQLFDELLEHAPDRASEMLDVIHAPAGLNIHAETPQEIALSILAEILSVVRHSSAVSLSITHNSL
ncbi:MAG: XdhC family protein [Reichenbachiella sp.]